MSKNTAKQQENRKKYRAVEQYVSFYNSERYSDPTAAIAINSVVYERRRRRAAI